MSATQEEQGTDRVDEGLRQWARGSLPDEAGVELLIRTGLAHRGDIGARYLSAADDRGHISVDTARMVDDYLDGGPPLGLSGGERRLLHLAASFLDSRITVSLNEALPGLDQHVLSLVSTAVHHASIDGGGFPR